MYDLLTGDRIATLHKYSLDVSEASKKQAQSGSTLEIIQEDALDSDEEQEMLSGLANRQGEAEARAEGALLNLQFDYTNLIAVYTDGSVRRWKLVQRY